MANRWLRGPLTPYLGGSSDGYNYCRAASIVMYYWFTKILGYTLIDEVIATTYRYSTSAIQTGTDGVFTNSNYQFSSASATFTSGMVGYFLAIQDNAHPVNAGIYRIDQYIDAHTVAINYYSPDFPALSTGCAWWLFNVVDGTLLTVNDLAVYRTTHATTPCEFYVKIVANALQYNFAVESGAWNVSTNAWNAGTAILPKLYSITVNEGMNGPRSYGFGDTAGAFGMVMHHPNAGAGTKGFVIYGVLDPLFEPGRDAREKFMVGGGTTRGAGYGYGEVWSQNLNRGAYPARWLYWSYYGADYFAITHTLPNSRDGVEYDAMPIWVVGDAGADVAVPSAYPVRALWGSMPKDYIWLATVKGLVDLTTFFNDTFIHWQEAVVTPWPGIRRS
jgi:hypothetical protein